MPGIFNSGFNRAISDARRFGISTPELAPTNLWDVQGSTWDVEKVELRTGGVARLEQALIFQEMERLAPFDFEFNPLQYASEAAAVAPPALYRVAETEKYNQAIDFYKDNSDRIKALNEQNPDLPVPFKTYEDIHADVVKRQADLRARQHKIAAQASPADRTWGTLLGAGGAVMTDPIIVATLPWGGAARGTSHLAKIASAAASEAAIIAGIELVGVQPQIYLQKRSINSPYSMVDVAAAVLAAGVGGGVFRGIIQSSASAIQAYRVMRGAKSRAQAVQQLREAAATILDEADTPKAQAEAQALEELADVIESTPRGAPIEISSGQQLYDNNLAIVTVDKEARHLANIDQAQDDLADGRITDVEMDADPDAALVGAKEPTVEVDPRTVQVDAKRFQFKAGGDVEGVTDQLKGVPEWITERAGISIIYEQADGARFIVDGHQRLALAKRLIAAGGNDDIRMNAIVLREADGVTVGAARRRAALKNIAEGTGTALDAAKVLREIGVGGLADTNLPPTSALVRTAEALAELDQDAFVYVANVLKPEQYGMASIVGQLIEAGPEQLAAIRALVEAEPGTLAQARLIVQQIKAAGFQTTETMDLFGGRTISETLFKERARVLEKALNTIKKDTKTFRTLVERESEITGAGNVLERQSNIERLSDDEKAIQTLGRLANTKGPISDALNEAARRLKNGERIDAVTRDFLTAFRRSPTERYRSGPEVRDDGRPIQETVPAEDLEPQIGRAVELDKLSQSDRRKAEELFRAKQQRKVKTLAGLIGKDGHLAKRHQNELESIGELVAKETGAEHVRPPARGELEGKIVYDAAGDTIRYKGAPQIERKVKDKYDGEYWQITDVTRTSFIVDSPAASEAVIQALGKRLRSLDEGWHLHLDQGYTDRKVLVRYNDGLIGEVQIISREMWSAKFQKGGHDAYYKWRLTHHQDANGKLVVKDQEAFDSLNKEMADLYEGASQASNREFQSLFESLRASSKTSSTSTVRQRLPGEELDQAVSPPSAGSRTTTTGIPSQERRSTILSEGGERAVGIDETSDTIIPPKDQAEYINDVRALHPDDPEIDELAAAEARQAAAILKENPDIEIPELRVDADGKTITETRKATEVYDDLIEEDTRTTDMFTCMTGGGRG